MFHRLGHVMVRFSPVWIAGWLLLWLASEYATPAWRDVAQDHEFAFLPADAPSRVGEGVFARAFPEGQLGSSIVLVLHSQEPRGFAAADRRFADTVLEPALRKIAEAEGGLAVTPVTEDSPFDLPVKQPDRQPSIMARIRTPSAPGTGSLLVSEDGRAWLVVVELTTDFQAHRNLPTIEKIEDLIQTLQAEGKVPAGLQIQLTGSAVIGRDQIAAQIASGHATERWTIILVVGLLILIYRAPLLTLIPLLTVFVAVRIAINLLAMLAAAGYVTVFEGLQIYITIVAYGAGVDYCLFLIARYKEELDQGGDMTTAMGRAIGNVGAALTASAATVMAGIGMMVFAEFGKFHQAGIAMPLSILMVLLATVSFAAPLTHLCGRWALWPYGQPSTHLANGSPKRPADFMERQWQGLAAILTRRPGLIGLTTVALMTPFAAAGLLLQGHQSYDVISSLPVNAPSVQGRAPCKSTLFRG
jgi:RND superfamily putative drug exporter